MFKYYYSLSFPIVVPFHRCCCLTECVGRSFVLMFILRTFSFAHSLYIARALFQYIRVAHLYFYLFNILIIITRCSNGVFGVNMHIRNSPNLNEKYVQMKMKQKREKRCENIEYGDGDVHANIMLVQRFIFARFFCGSFAGGGSV